MTVTQIKTVETDGYDAVQFGFEDAKPHRVNKPMTGHFEKGGVAPKKHLAEFRPEEGETYEVGQADHSCRLRSRQEAGRDRHFQRVKVLRVTSRDTDTTEDL